MANIFRNSVERYWQLREESTLFVSRREALLIAIPTSNPIHPPPPPPPSCLVPADVFEFQASMAEFCLLVLVQIFKDTTEGIHGSAQRRKRYRTSSNFKRNINWTTSISRQFCIGDEDSHPRQASRRGGECDDVIFASSGSILQESSNRPAQTT